MTEDLFNIFHISFLMLIGCIGAILRVNVYKRRYFVSCLVIILFTCTTIILVRNLYNIDVVAIFSIGVILGYFIFYILYNLLKNQNIRTEKLKKELSEIEKIIIDKNKIVSNEKLKESIMHCASKVDDTECGKEHDELLKMLIELQIRRDLDKKQ